MGLTQAKQTIAIRMVCVSLYMTSISSIYLLALNWNVIAIADALSLR
jgi:hypothetical protein